MNTLKYLSFTLTCLFLMALSATCLGQTENLKKWIEANGIELNAPSPPAGFNLFHDCDGLAVYKKVYGDTIHLFTSRASMAQDLSTFKKTVKNKGFNVFEYPSKYQTNGTVIVQQFREKIFVWRNDTLYLLDDFNLEEAQVKLNAIEQYASKRISKGEYKKLLEQAKQLTVDFTPKFKIIYFTGIFDEASKYQFSSQENFRKEKVTLESSWIQDNETCFQIHLQTHTDGNYTFSESMTFLNLEGCLRVAE
jgi:hypothetical protein